MTSMLDAERLLVADTDRVEMVLSRVGPDQYRAATASGACTFTPSEHGFEVVATEGVDPLADQAVDRFIGLAAEADHRMPDASANAYPYAYDQIVQFFDHPDAPDLMVVRTAAFHVHGNMGEHGSLGAVQSRAAFVAAGPGIVNDGIVDEHLRAIDVAPTIAAVLGCAADDDGRHLRGSDGRATGALLTGDTADHVVAFLFDGLNANLLLDALDAGDVPNIAALVERGTCYRHGSLASLPTVTLPNHTTLLTGAHPGHHGILSNSWKRRATGETPNLLDWDQMIHASDSISSDVETIYEAIARTHTNAFTACTYEYCDRGADWSSYGELRAGRRLEGVPSKSDDVPLATSDWFASSSGYHFMSRIDTASTAQACALLDPEGPFPTPTFLWVNYSLTDEAGHHAGPHGREARDALIDTDARLGTVMAALEAAGIADRTAVFVLADHGMEETNPAVTGHYRSRLEAESVAFDDIDDGLIYLT